MLKRLIVAAMLIIWMSSCNLTQRTEEGTSLSAIAPQTWIDAPLNNSEIPLAPYEIVFHANASAGVNSARVFINGDLLGVLDGHQQQMETMRQAWQPADPGTYQIAVRAEDTLGQTGNESVVQVFVVAPATHTPEVAAATGTTEATQTPQPTLTSTPTVTPIPTQAPLLAGLTVDPHQVFNGNCGENEITFQVQINDPQTIKHVYLFVRLQDAVNGETTNWNSGYAMVQGEQEGSFQYILPVENIAQINQYDSAFLQYQFVGTDYEESVVARSQTYDDVAVAQCGFLPPLIPIQPTTPPFFTIVVPTPTATNTPVIIR